MTAKEALRDAIDTLGADNRTACINALFSSLGCSTNVEDPAFDESIVQPELAVFVLSTLISAEPELGLSAETRKYVADASRRMLSGKPVDGVSDSTMEADIDGNLDLL